MAEEANRAGDIHHPGLGVEEGEEDLTSSLVVPVVGLQRLLGLHGEGFRGVLLEGYPGIVDQDVNTAVFLLHEISQLDDRLLVANVQHVELGVQPLLSEGLHCRLAPALVPGGEVNISLVTKQKLCMNQDIKNKIETNFGPVEEILESFKYQITENQLFTHVNQLLQGSEEEYM